MSAIKKMQIGAAVVKAKVFNQRNPFSVNLSLTNRCNLNCAYCSLPDRESEELSTKQVLKLIDEMALAGVVKLGISGGEPLLREDFDIIINEIKKRNIFISLTTNGTLVEKWLQTLKKIDCLLVSIDGPQEVHDITGKWNVGKLLEAIRKLKENNIPVAASSVLTKPSIFNLDYLFKLSKEHGMPLAFQPYSYLKFLSITKTKSCDIVPSKEELRMAIERIIKAKKDGALVLNSYQFLNLIEHGNIFGSKWCLAGKRYCYIDTNGDVYPCSPMTERMPAFNAAETGFMDSFSRMPAFSCGEGCAIACYADYNYLFSLNWKFLATLFWVSLKSKKFKCN